MSSRPIIEGRAQILLGDTTSHGGVVISGSPTTTVEGRPIARVGDMVTCPLCKPHVFPIVEGLTTFTDNYMAVALHGHKIACGATLMASAAKPEAPTTPAPGSTSNPFEKELGKDLNELVSKSPTLTEDLEILSKEKWTIEYGAAGGGSSANRDKKLITLDPNLKSDTKSLVQVLSHEVGHARYPFKPDYSTKATYLTDALDDEGAAVMKNIKVQREILDSTKIDIGIAGQPANTPIYENAYNQSLKDGDYKSAIRKIGEVFRKGEYTSTTKETYEDMHGKWYDNDYLPWCKKYCKPK
jgi:type VI secretion system secreted protein VgrG